jgi:tetratricopeptide (TPR) repeat protein
MRELCEQASRVERTALAPAVASAKRASHRTTVEDQLRRGWPEDALASTRAWEVAFPKDKADGFTEFLRGKAFYGLRRFDDARKHFRLCRLLIPADDPATAETHFLDADALFWSGRRKEADAAFQQFLKDSPQSPFTKTAQRRLKTIEVIRMDLVDEPEPYLVEHQPYVVYGTVYPTTGHVPGWGGRCREVSRRSVLTYEFPISREVDRILLRFRKKGVTLLHVNDQQFWQEPHAMADEDMIDQELLFADRSLWSAGKLKLTFRDGLNYSPYMDPVILFIDWIELHLLRPE